MKSRVLSRSEYPGRIGIHSNPGELVRSIQELVPGPLLGANWLKGSRRGLYSRRRRWWSVPAACRVHVRLYFGCALRESTAMWQVATVERLSSQHYNIRKNFPYSGMDLALLNSNQTIFIFSDSLSALQSLNFPKFNITVNPYILSIKKSSFHMSIQTWVKVK